MNTLHTHIAHKAHTHTHRTHTAHTHTSHTHITHTHTSHKSRQPSFWFRKHWAWKGRFQHFSDLLRQKLALRTNKKIKELITLNLNTNSGFSFLQDRIAFSKKQKLILLNLVRTEINHIVTN